jgi:hypothetical protein
MSFVGGPYAHDVFVSYAHGHDLEASYGGPHRNHLYSWSCTFIDNLREEIERLLSGSDRTPDVWMDPALKPIGSLEGSLKKEIQSSALLVTLMSSYYLRSQWCADEARIFSDFARDFRPVDRQDRIFVVAVAPTERKAWPPALQDDGGKAFLGAKFYRERGPESWTPLGWPDPSVAKDEDYWTAITSLASEITSQLRRMKHAQENSTSAGDAAEVPVFVGRKLLLGYCSDTLTRDRDHLRSALSSMEMQILPGESDDITDQKSLESSYDAYLEQADAVVLVANEYCGSWPKGEEAGFISLQVRKARERAKRCYMWLNIQKPDQIQTDSYDEYLKKLPGEIEKSGGGILTGDQDIKAFANFVKSKLAALDKSDFPRPAIICSNLSSRTNEYKQFHEWILDALGELNSYAVTIDAGSGQIRLSALAEQVHQSDTILVVCFDQEWDWAKEVLLQLKLVSPSDSAKRARLLVVGPHFDPAKGLFEFRNYHFKTFNGSSLDATSFKETLKQAIQQNRSNITQPMERTAA